MYNNLCISPLFIEQVQSTAPWARFLGGPNFPQNPLYIPDSQFKDPDHLSIDYDQDGFLKSLLSTLGNDEATIDYDFFTESGINKLSATFKKNSATELTITEWFDQNTGYLTIRRPNYSNYDVDITIEAVDGKAEEFDTTVTFNGKTLNDIIKYGELDVPELVMNFAEEVSTVQTSLSVAAFNERLAGILTIEAYKQQQELGYRNIVWHVINTIVAIVAGALAGSAIVGIVVHAVSMLLIPSELH